MNETDWRAEVEEWMVKFSSAQSDELSGVEIKFFEKAFNHTHYPEECWFGVHKTGISLVIGGIYLAAIQRAEEDKGIWLLVDERHPALKDLEFRSVKSTKNSSFPLVWAHAHSIQQMPVYTSSNLMWMSYSFASEKIVYAPISKNRDSV